MKDSGESPTAAVPPTGLHAALGEVVERGVMTEGFSTMVLEWICRPLARNLDPRQAALLAGGGQGARLSAGARGAAGAADERLLRQTSPGEAVAAALHLGALHRLPEGASGRYDEEGAPVPLELNLPLLRVYHAEASLAGTVAERDESAFRCLRRRVRAEIKSLRRKDDPLYRLRVSLRGKLDNALKDRAAGALECVSHHSRDGNGILRFPGSDGEPVASLDLAAVARSLGEIRRRGSARGSEEEKLAGLPSPAEMGELLRRVLRAPDPADPSRRVEALTVFDFLDLCIAVFGIPTPEPVELSWGGEEEGSRTLEETLTSADVSARETPETRFAALPVVGFSPGIPGCARAMAAAVRARDAAELPPQPWPEARRERAPGAWDEGTLAAWREKVRPTQWQQTLAEGVLWAGQPLTAGAGSYTCADFVRLSGHASAEAYRRWDRTLGLLGGHLTDPTYDLAPDERGLPLRLLMRKYLPWKPEIVAAADLDLPRGLNLA